MTPTQELKEVLAAIAATEKALTKAQKKHTAHKLAEAHRRKTQRNEERLRRQWSMANKLASRAADLERLAISALPEEKPATLASKVKSLKKRADILRLKKA